MLRDAVFPRHIRTCPEKQRYLRKPAMSIIPFDDRDAKIHVLSHALHYASCVFEGERVYGGTVFKLREHSQRLLDSAKILGFEIPYTVEQIDAATNETVAAMNIRDGYVRPVAWRGAE